MGSGSKLAARAAIAVVCLCAAATAQEPTGAIEGQITDPSNLAVTGAQVTAHNEQTGLSRTARSSTNGTFHIASLPAGEYAVEVGAPGFAQFSARGVRVNIGQSALCDVRLEVAGAHSAVNVMSQMVMVDTSQTIGNTVEAREAEDLPLNGRDLTQLGLLQPGVAPLTAGLAEAGGIARSGQAFAVNGERPESNNYLLDGASNLDSVNGGYALRVPVDAVSEFRILTLNAPAEYGNTSGVSLVCDLSGRIHT